MEIEIWKDVVGYEGLYKVSNFGRVKSLDRYIRGNRRKNLVFKKGRIRVLPLNKWGYRVCTLSNDGHLKLMTVHRIVAMAFLNNEENKPMVNHIDCDKKNNQLLNLEWVTAVENMAHAYENNLVPINRRGKHCCAKLVIDLNTGIYYECLKDASEAKGIGYSLLKEMMRGAMFNRTGFKYV